MTATTTITVTVPTERVTDLYAYIATLFAAPAPNPVAKTGVPPTDLTLEDVQEAFLGGTNNQPWRDLLIHLSLHPGEEVFWPDLCDAVGYNRKTMSGVIGAGERRTKGKRPYTKRYVGDDTYFLMSDEVAKLVQQVAANQ